jgi:hypothetical protein
MILGSLCLTDTSLLDSNLVKSQQAYALESTASISSSTSMLKIESLEVNSIVSEGNKVVIVTRGTSASIGVQLSIEKLDLNYAVYVQVKDITENQVITIFEAHHLASSDPSSSKQISFNWIPSDYGSYSIQAFAIANPETQDMSWQMASLILSSLPSDDVKSSNESISVNGSISNSASQNESSSSHRSDALIESNYTVLIYMVASNLEADGYYSTQDIAEMKNATIENGNGINIVLETGGSANATVDNYREIDFTKVQRHIIRNQVITTIDDLGQQNMGEAKTLTDFIKWGVSKYPAKHYALVLWDHGAGINGFGFDDISNDILTLEEIKQAISEGYSSSASIMKGAKFELIGFDSCLMATLEVATVLAPYSNYLVASQEIEPAWGWDYTAIFNSLNASADEDGRTLGKVIADSYMEQAKKKSQLGSGYDVQDTLTMSVVYLSKVNNVENAVVDLAGNIKEQVFTMPGSVSFARAIQQSERYGVSGSTDSGQVDLYSFASSISSSFEGIGGLTSPVNKAVSDAVVYEVHGNAKSNSHGLSVYMSTAGSGYGTSISKNAFPQWLAAMKQASNLLSTDVTPPHVFLEHFENEIVTGTIGRDDLAAIYTIVTSKSPDGGASRYRVLSVDQVVNYSSIFTTNSKTDEQVQFKWNKQILSLCDQHACLPVAAFRTGSSEQEVLFVPVRLESNSTFRDVVMLYSKQNVTKADAGSSNYQYKFLGAWPGIDQEGIASRELLPLLPGEKIFTSLNERDYEDTSYSKYIELGPLVVETTSSHSIDNNYESANYATSSEGVVLKYDSIAGDYGVSIVACDFSNNCNYSYQFRYKVQ